MKLAVPFLQFPLRFDADALAAEVAAIGEEAWRPHPNGLPGNSALTLITTDGIADSDKVYGPMLPTEHLRACPYLQQVLASVGATWGRTRLMRLSGQAEVDLHVDINYYWRERMRVHVPIVTQPTVRFICGEAEINMAAGECWIFDTWRLHRVVNDDSRAHPPGRRHRRRRRFLGIHRRRPSRRARAARLAAALRRAGAGRDPALDYESVNAPVVMTPVGNARAHELPARRSGAGTAAGPGPCSLLQAGTALACALVLSWRGRRRLAALSRAARRDDAGAARAERRTDAAKQHPVMIEGLAALVLAVGLKQRRAGLSGIAATQKCGLSGIAL